MELDNEIRRHIYTIPPLVRSAYGDIQSDCRSTVEKFSNRAVRQVILTGCGYSYAACLAARDYIQARTHLPVTVLPTIEVARFSDLSGDFLSNTLLVAISNSGMVSRVNEALAVYEKHGAITLGITSNQTAQIAQYCRYLLPVQIPPMERPLPLRGYALTELALMSLGDALALERGTTTPCEIGRAEEQMLRSMEELEASLPAIDRVVRDYALHCREFEAFEFIGSGYERGPAFLGKIEMMGQAGVMATDEDAEQWLHCNFFLAAPEQIGTMLFFAAGSRASSRTAEALEYMEHLKRPVCVVTDGSVKAGGGTAAVVFVPALSHLNAGIVEMVPPSLLAGYLCQLRGEVYSRGFRDQWAIFRDGRGTTKSRLVIE